MCDSEDSSQEQRLLRNMGAYKVVLDLLEVPYDNVRYTHTNHTHTHAHTNHTHTYTHTH